MFRRFFRPKPAPEPRLIAPERQERALLAETRRALGDQVIQELRESQLGPDQQRYKAAPEPPDPVKIADFVGVPATRFYLTADDATPKRVQVMKTPLIAPDPDQTDRDLVDLGIVKSSKHED